MTAREAVFAFCRRPPDWQATTMREVFGMDVPWPGDVREMMRHLRDTNQRQAFIDHMASLPDGGDHG